MLGQYRRHDSANALTEWAVDELSVRNRRGCSSSSMTPSGAVQDRKRSQTSSTGTLFPELQPPEPEVRSRSPKRMAIGSVDISLNRISLLAALRGGIAGNEQDCDSTALHAHAGRAPPLPVWNTFGSSFTRCDMDGWTPAAHLE